MVYKVVFRDEARKAFERLDRAVREQVGRVIDRLADNPRPGQATQLVGILGPGECVPVISGSCTKFATTRSWS